MSTKLDMHLHTRGSDGTGEPHEFVAAIQKAGLNGIVITDHHLTWSKPSIQVYLACKAAGLICLMGSEYSTKEGHCLVYGVDVQRMGWGLYPKMQDVIDRVAELGGVAFPSHPFRGVKETLGPRIFELQNLTHAEVLNGQNAAGNGWASSARPEANDKAKNAAVIMGLGSVGGSDAHVPSRIGTCYTEFSGTVKDTQDLLDALRSKDHKAVVNEEMVEAQRAAQKLLPPISTQSKWNWDSWRAQHLDKSTGGSYYGHRNYLDDQQDQWPEEYIPDFGDEHIIPESAFDDFDTTDLDDVSERPEDVQRFLQRHAILKAPKRKTKLRKGKRK